MRIRFFVIKGRERAGAGCRRKKRAEGSVSAKLGAAKTEQGAAKAFHSTVTLLARLRGLSGSCPSSTAVS